MIKITVTGTKEYYKEFKDNRTVETKKSSVEIKQLFSGTVYQITVSAVTGGGVGAVKITSKALEVSGRLTSLSWYSLSTKTYSLLS